MCWSWRERKTGNWSISQWVRIKCGTERTIREKEETKKKRSEKVSWFFPRKNKKFINEDEKNIAGNQTIQTGTKTQMTNRHLIDLKATKVVCSFFLKSWTRAFPPQHKWCSGRCSTPAILLSLLSWRLPACGCHSLSLSILSSALLLTWPCTCACLTSLLLVDLNTCTETFLSSSSNTHSIRAWCRLDQNQCYQASLRGTITTQKGKGFIWFISDQRLPLIYKHYRTTCS